MWRPPWYKILWLGSCSSHRFGFDWTCTFRGKRPDPDISVSVNVLTAPVIDFLFSFCGKTKIKTTNQWTIAAFKTCLERKWRSVSCELLNLSVTEQRDVSYPPCALQTRRSSCIVWQCPKVPGLEVCLRAPPWGSTWTKSCHWGRYWLQNRQSEGCWTAAEGFGLELRRSWNPVRWPLQ